MKLLPADNHPDTMPFVVAVGKLLQNFGLIELQTHEWIAAFQVDPMVGQLAKRSKLRDRIALVQKMIDRSERVSTEDKKELKDLWSRVLPHAEVRNIVAHSPVSMGFPGNDPGESAHFVGVLNLNPRDKSRDFGLISVEEINGSVNATHAIGSELMASLAALQKGGEGT